MFNSIIKPIIDAFRELLGGVIADTRLLALGITGAVLATGGVLGGVMAPTQSVAVVLTFFGTALGTLVLMPVFRKLLAVDSDTRMTQAALAREHDARLVREREVVACRQEISRLEKRRIDVNRITPVMKLGLLEVEMNITDFSRKCFDAEGNLQSEIEQTPGHWEYIGFLRKTFKTTLGVDLERLMLFEDGDRLWISGLSGVSLGLKDLETKRELGEVRVRERSMSSPRKGELVVQDLHAQTPKFDMEQEKTLQTGVNKSVPLENMDKHIKRLAEGWLRIILAPLEKQIVFGDPPPSIANGKAMMAYLMNHDSAVASEIEQKELAVTGQGISVNRA
ncbi:MAG: hypothetical protein ABMA26_21225 [Limisphaerales bacterium]